MYTLGFIFKQDKKIVPSSADLQFSGEVYKLAPDRVSFEDIDKEIVTTKVAFDVSQAAKSILTEQSAKITIYTKNAGDINWDVPEDIIDEWQEVIKR